MHARSPRPSGRARFAALAAAAVLGLGAALTGASPAVAAPPAPTLSGPESTVGFGRVTLTGTATPGATVRLIDAAAKWRDDMDYADDHHNGDILVTTADSSGNFTLSRTMDSGFVFAADAEVDGQRSPRSNVVTVAMFVRAGLTVTPSGTNIQFTARSDISQPWLPVAIQRQNGSGWTTVLEGYTAENGEYTSSLTGLTAGETHSYRAAIGPDKDNEIRTSYSATVSLVVGGPGTPTTQPTTAPPTTTPPTTRPPTTTPTTRPTTTPPTTTPPTTRPTTTPPTTTPPTTQPPTTSPAPTPTSPKPTPTATPTPPPAGPRVGDVRFSLVQYNPPGTDRANNAGYNQEYFRITNYTTKTINLKYWTVKDRAGNTYRFGTDFYLRGLKNVYVLTGKGTDGKPSSYRYWGRTGYIWNNTGDAAYLRTGSNKLIDSCSWGKGSGRTSC